MSNTTNNEGSVNIPLAEDPLAHAVKQYIKEHYEPAVSVADNSLNLTTQEIMERIQSIYPTSFDASDLAHWLQQQGFTFADMGDMKFFWLIKPV